MVRAEELLKEAIKTALTARPKSTADGFAKAWPAAKGAWQNASDAVDAQISRLQGKLIEVTDLARIAAAQRGFLAKWKQKYSEVMLVKTVETALIGSVEKSMWELEKQKAYAVPNRDILLGDEAVQGVPALPKAGERKRSFIFESVIPRLLELTDFLPFVVAVGKHQATASRRAISGRAAIAESSHFAILSPAGPDRR